MWGQPPSAVRPGEARQSPQYFSPAFGEIAGPSGVTRTSVIAGAGIGPPSASVPPQFVTGGFRSLSSNACVVVGSAASGLIVLFMFAPP
jgi:hypothetical protein